MNNDAILASISKIHAYRYVKEKQRGALTTNGGFLTKDFALLQVPCTIQCVFSLDELSDTDNTIFSTTLDNKGAKINYRSDRKRLLITLEENFYSIENISLDHIYNIVFTSDSYISKVYVDGTEVLSIEKAITNTKYLIGWNFYNIYGNCNYLLHRHFNYAMSADKVKTLDNNGDPLGYIVPKVMKSGDNKCIAEYVAPNLVATKKGPQVEPTAESFEFNIGSPYSQTVIESRQYPFDCIYRIDYIVDEWDFQPRVNRLIGFHGKSGASIVAGVISWIRKNDAKIGEVQSCFIKMPNEGNPSILLYGDQDNEETTARRLKVTIKSITPVSVASTWLDSAKQLPWSDKYLPPLLQSKGGYDMVANGAPEVLFKDTTIKAGVKLGYNQTPSKPSTLKFTSTPIHIGTDDFSIEFWGNTYGASGAFYNPTLFFNNGGDGTFSISVNSIGINGIQWVYFGRDAAGGTGQDTLNPNYIAPTQERMFHCVVTRSGTLVKCFIEGEQKAQKTQILLHDYGDVTIGIANSSNIGFVRVYNYALSQEEVTTLYNGGKPDSYVLPQSMKSQDNKCIAEYLAQNLVADPSDTNSATGWLDSAKQLPVNDSSLSPLEKSIGGYDMTASNKPQIIYKSIWVNMHN